MMLRDAPMAGWCRLLTDEAPDKVILATGAKPSETTLEGPMTATTCAPNGVDAGTAYFRHTLSHEPVIMDGVDTLVTSLGHMAETTLAVALAGEGYEVHAIGDCLNPRTVEVAVLEVLKVAAAL